MTIRCACVVFALCAVFATGCKTTQGRRGDDAERAMVESAIAQEAGRFLDLARAQDYAGIAAMVTSSQAKGFDAREFVENRFRMPLGAFELLGRSEKRVAVTPVEGTRYHLSTGVAVVRLLSTNETTPYYVNLYWTKEQGNWKIVPYPKTD